MVRGMDERFDDPSEEDNGELEDSDETVEETSEAERDDSEVESADQEAIRTAKQCYHRRYFP